MAVNIKCSLLEANILSHFLKDLENELSILSNTMLPSKPFEFINDCPDLNYSKDESNIWKIQRHLKAVIEIMKQTSKELFNMRTFEVFKEAIPKLSEPIEEMAKAQKEEQKIKAFLKINKHKLKEVNFELVDARSSILHTQLEEELKTKLEATEKKWKNKLAYFTAFFDSKLEGLIEVFQKTENDISNKIKMNNSKVKLEERCTQEMRKFLQMCRKQLADELDNRVQAHEAWRVQADMAAMTLRMRTKRFTEEALVLQQVYEERAEEMSKYKLLKEGVKRRQEAALVIQTWWRAVMVTKEEELLKPVQEKKKKRRKAKK